AVAGTGAASLGAEHPNVRIYLAADRIRKHRLGTMFSQLLQAIPQWAEVLGTTGIDPIRDFDHILLSGPQMRDPSYVVVTLDYNLSAAKMGETVRRVSAAAPGGRRLKDAPVPAWVIGQRGERIAALHPKRRLLVIVPRAAEDKLGAVKKMRGFERSTDRIIALYIVTPWRAFRGTGFRFPESVKWLRLVLLPTDEDDQFLLQVEAEDASADAAAKDALQLGADLELVRVIDLGDIPFFGKQVELIGRPEIQVHGNRIHATAPVSEAQLRRIMKVIIPRLEAQGERRRAGGKGGGKG
ncbi:MAG: hypothetical protein HY744_19265, partial [Deltaproteobacteria bacterium]|nr:hypothetical protein [Deltaproteobacteria bacterium]